MKTFILPALLLFGLVFVASCSKDRLDEDEWTIPTDDVRDGGPGKDGIPSVDAPRFSDADAVTYLTDADLVVGIVVDGEARAYPHPILDWHEIVNDEIRGTHLSITYCPLTGTAIAWDRFLDGEVTTFGVSGLLFESNLIPYDRKTNSHWSQMRLDCVNGPLVGQRIPTFPIVETTWATWKAMYPETKVLTTETGFDRNYGLYPYDDYRTNDQYFLFPITTPDERLSAKERVHGVRVNDQAKVYRFDAFQSGTTLIRDNFAGEDIVVAGNAQENWIVSFKVPVGTGDLEAVVGEGPVIMADTAGNHYDVLGQVIDGPDMGTQLQATDSYIGFWFAWATFFPSPEIY